MPKNPKPRLTLKKKSALRFITFLSLLVRLVKVEPDESLPYKMINFYIEMTIILRDKSIL